MVRERDLQRKGASSILGGGFPFFNRNTSNKGEVFQYQFENFLSLLKMAATVYKWENCNADQHHKTLFFAEKDLPILLINSLCRNFVLFYGLPGIST